MRKSFHFVVFVYVNKNFLKNKKLFGMRKNDIENSALQEDFKKDLFLFQKDTVQSKFEDEIILCFRKKRMMKKKKKKTEKNTHLKFFQFLKLGMLSKQTVNELRYRYRYFAFLVAF